MEKLDDTWNSRDLPFLIEIAQRLEANPHGPIWGHEAAAAVGLSEQQHQAATARLISAGYIEVQHLDQFEDITGISESAARAVGLWPTPETGLERMIAALEAIAANASDDDTRSRARKILEGFGGAGKQIAIATATAVVTGQIPT
ncbi:hypothetical protein EV645_3992 [Kribbella rubisoli]|uniref:Uncharacterized protein n=1 Tax=Kribbella rubisoli TaxID=3075929 RepID=A0A4Q7X0P2_9ACTN|nr:hypothetical protein [Kribbella rubisoli]RZU16427.1 hypothetical protein EV645_3992 [Kribbella rubisoli]